MSKTKKRKFTTFSELGDYWGEFFVVTLKEHRKLMHWHNQYLVDVLCDQPAFPRISYLSVTPLA